MYGFLANMSESGRVDNAYLRQVTAKGMLTPGQYESITGEAYAIESDKN